MNRRILLIGTTLMMVASTGLSVLKPNTAHAISGSDFRAGRIIDDAIFFNKNAMSVAQIQQFLNAKLPVCDRTHASSNPTYQPPYTCLNEYIENTTTKENNYGRFDGNGSPIQIAGGKSAAQIIWDAGQQYGINPQVLLVMLQKEQSLVTDNWPWKIQFDKAMGYACPDTAACNSKYYGLYNQIDSAAWQLKRYISNPADFNFRSGVTRYIQYNPNAACGGANVYIENGATAALYNYTPYQPNPSALANLYGSGDSCGAYGNRNFWRLFNDWFGSTYSAISKFQVFSLAHPTGTLVQHWSGGTVYKIIDGYRLPIPSYSVFLSNKYTAGSVKIMNYGDETQPISTKALGYRGGTIIREIGSPKIYAIECTSQFYESCTKRHISNYDTFLSLGYKETDVQDIPAGDLAGINDGSPLAYPVAHPEGSLVRDNVTNKIFLLNGGLRYHVPSALLFNLYRFDWNKVKTINQLDEAKQIGSGFPAIDTNLLAKPMNDVKVYAISENGYGTEYKRHVTSFETFTLLGYSEREVLPLEQSLIDNFVTVPPYPF